ncbi:2-hydroxyhepta-2,4-diene-1,7-dioate isomerase [Capsulimonas corticalis]|uniref:2-hydroxyhepta-2,4-diene-1,7-dioate isomerase n=1 Tax=Capsulimonas corticalis TaxID=2219043 RepID=A0A402D4Q3_9BACT|nr:fumarylacetoacetate hydrolase family protein [Capsulimonas corticalis]BDI29284.1 2-hydroxyhepta-2,4-diene-1,7-dioate isomerase [Capsulimonas corticalis]
MKFVCYKEFDDPLEPTYPGIMYKGKILPLARVVAVAEAVHPRSLNLPEDLNHLVALLPTYVEAVKELEKGKILDQIWQELGVSPVAPLPRPNRILAIGRNYADHAAEQDADVPIEPIVFLKASSSVIGPEAEIVLPEGVGRVDYEGELAVVIGKSGKNIAERDAMGYVVGYTLFNDVTARDEQKRAFAQSLPWFLSKSYDTFGPMGPCLVTADEIRNPHNLEITTTLNGIVKQQANTSQMLFTIPQLIAFISKRIALEPGDVIITGTPSGIGPIHAGDLVEVRIPEIGSLSNNVVNEGE